MAAVLISIRPEWCEKIASGEKTIEVRKTRPKLEPPFKCYIYCTACRDFYRIGCMRYGCDELYKTPDGDVKYGTSVELMAFDDNDYGPENFLNRKVIGEFVCDRIITVDCDSVAPFDRETKDYIDGETCMSREVLWKYSSGRCAYGWNISDLKIYDTPKELSDYQRMENGTMWSYPVKITRPPQSWMYVEELI